MIELPKYLIKDLVSGHTSLGKHPCFPPGDEEEFPVKAVASAFAEIADGIDVVNTEELKKGLTSALIECQRIESKNKGALEQLCVEVVNEIFSIPEDTVTVEANLVSSVDVSDQREIPEETSDYSFESVDDMNRLTDEVYKRRILNALVCGASMSISSNIDKYLNKVFKINSELPSLYSKIMKYNNILLYFEKDTINKKGNNLSAGRVDVVIGGTDTPVSIKSQGIIFPVLLSETVKGLLELAISHGLPKERSEADFVTKKSDFRLAELWDMKLGFALWRIISSLADLDDEEEVEPNFLLMELSELPVDEFNIEMREILAKTKRGKKYISDIVENIKRDKGRDDFDDYMKSQGEKYQMDDGYFTDEELLLDSEY